MSSKKDYHTLVRLGITSKITILVIVLKLTTGRSKTLSNYAIP